MAKIKNDISPLDLQYEIKKAKLTQRDVANLLGVTDGAVSGAIKGDPLLRTVRERIIELLNSK